MRDESPLPSPLDIALIKSTKLKVKGFKVNKFLTLHFEFLT
jgi:hypothetical protein